MVDWGVARQTARLASRSEPAPDLGIDVAAMARSIEDPVIRHTGLTPEEPLPRVEVVSRAEWATANLATMSDLLDPVTAGLGDRLGAAGPLAGVLRIGAGATIGAEVGLVTGYLAQHVLGQYELSLLGTAARPRLLLVATNLDRAASTLRVNRESFLRWVTIHELVHALQFGGVPWLRDHLGSLLRSYLATIEQQTPGAGRPGLPRPEVLIARVREGGLAALVQTPDQRNLLARVQATMAVIEGHAEHVMDALAPQLVPEHEGLRSAMERRRDGAAPVQRVLMKLLGMDMKMRQYREGKAFCDAVVAAEGQPALARLWSGPEALPTPVELADPRLWLARS